MTLSLSVVDEVEFVWLGHAVEGTRRRSVVIGYSRGFGVPGSLVGAVSSTAERLLVDAPYRTSRVALGSFPSLGMRADSSRGRDLLTHPASSGAYGL
jgi:hypothetical protein